MPFFEVITLIEPDGFEIKRRLFQSIQQISSTIALVRLMKDLGLKTRAHKKKLRNLKRRRYRIISTLRNYCLFGGKFEGVDSPVRALSHMACISHRAVPTYEVLSFDYSKKARCASQTLYFSWTPDRMIKNWVSRVLGVDKNIVNKFYGTEAHLSRIIMPILSEEPDCLFRGRFVEYGDRKKLHKIK